MSLATAQSAFMAQILDEDVPQPDAWGDTQSAGMAVYRNNYRSSIVEALRSTYERTARWVGETAFRQAAAHHIISHPPASWTLDEAGRGFDETCAELFPNDPEVAELAWLEWTMLDIFTLQDCVPLDQTGFAAATADFAEEDWGAMRLQFSPGATQATVEHDLLTLWNTLSEEEFERADLKLDAPLSCLIWREGERPVFALSSVEEGAAFAAMAKGATYEEACAVLATNVTTQEEAEQAAMQAGAMLGRWLNDGLITAVNPA